MNLDYVFLYVVSWYLIVLYFYHWNNSTYKIIYHLFSYEIRSSKCLLNEWLHHFNNIFLNFLNKVLLLSSKDRFDVNLYFNREHFDNFATHFCKNDLQCLPYSHPLHSIISLSFFHFSLTFDIHRISKEFYGSTDKTFTYFLLLFNRCASYISIR